MSRSPILFTSQYSNTRENEQLLSFWEKNTEINATFDHATNVQTATNADLGLTTEAPTIDELEYKLQEMIPERAELNHIDVPRPLRFKP
ncbi:MAG: DUF1902 domain-containing protein [Spirochaetaceae bacterium]|nr:MAG: DUF1902 domain-containing protein [Spirochaetaceae bacterium]